MKYVIGMNTTLCKVMGRREEIDAMNVTDITENGVAGYYPCLFPADSGTGARMKPPTRLLKLQWAPAQDPPLRAAWMTAGPQ